MQASGLGAETRCGTSLEHCGAVGRARTWMSALANLSFEGPAGSHSSTMYSTRCRDMCHALKGCLKKVVACSSQWHSQGSAFPPLQPQTAAGLSCLMCLMCS